MPQTTERTISKLNPATGELIAEYVAASESQVEQAVSDAQGVQETWQHSSLKQRVGVLKTIRDKLHERAGAIAEIISRETGKPIADSLEADIATALNVLSYYAEIGINQLKPRIIQPDLISLITGRLHRETFYPRGIIAIISPWNFPMAISSSGVAAALMAGNSVLLKPSELTPATGETLIQIVRESLEERGFSSNIAQLLMGDGVTGAHLLEQPIDGVIFTGSERTGRIIAQKAAERGLWCSLELGGSDAMIVLEGCDLDKAASYALWGRFVNAGQTCAAVKRLLVPASMEVEFLNLLADKMKRLKVGPPGEPDSHMGPLINEAQRTLIEDQVQDALQKGARLIAGGRTIPGPGFFYEPTLFADVPADARILNEETFGPVLPVLPYTELEEVIRMANDSRFGLTASVFGPPDQAKEVAARLHSGTVVINEVGPTNFALACAPWGGWKNSGSGCSHGAASLRDLSRLKVVSENLLFGFPLLSKPLWHFGSDSRRLGERSKTVLAFAARHSTLMYPLRWLPFWHHRASTKF